MNFFVFKFLILTFFAMVQGQTEEHDCAYWNKIWNLSLKAFEEFLDNNACGVVKHAEEGIKSIKEANPPNWKELITEIIESMSEKHSYGNTKIFHEFIQGDVFDRKVNKYELQEAIKENKPMDVFPVTCIEDFGYAHRIFFEPNRKLVAAYARFKKYLEMRK